MYHNIEIHSVVGLKEKIFYQTTKMNKKISQSVIAFCIGVFSCVPLFAEIKMSAIFGNKMVLQRETNVNIWGTANIRANVDIVTSWNGNTYSTQALVNGRWALQIPTPLAGGPYNITIIDRSDNKIVTLDSVLIGEVWVCSGQSNMAMTMKGYTGQPVNNSEAAIATSFDPLLRLFNVPMITGSEGPQDTFRGQPQSKRWVIADSATTTNFSAVAYFYGRILRQRLNIPIGIVNTSWGGTKIEAWMSQSSLTDINPTLDYVNPETEVWPQPKKSSCLFDYMINPMLGYGIRGFLWYQGEGNTGQTADYQKLLPTMIKDWRVKWGLGNLPFYYVQIAPFGTNTSANNGACLREAQLNVSNSMITPNLPNIGMVSILDIGEATSIHPAEKETVSRRLANLAFSNIYGITDINPYSPVLSTVTIENNAIKLSFKTFSDTTRLTSYGNTLANFEIAGANRVFYPATAVIAQDTNIVVSAASVPTPVAVRYGFKNFIVGDLFGTNGLPVSSFRIDSRTSLTLASWETSSQVQGGRSVAALSATTIDPDMTNPTELSRASGIVVPTTIASNGYWGGNEWTTGTAQDGIAANKFLTFSLKAGNLKSVNYQAIDKFNIRISATGPLKYQIDYQIDSGAFNTCATLEIPTRPTASANYALGSVDLSNISALQNLSSRKTVTFRITPYNASTTSSSFLFGNGTSNTEADLRIIGSFSDNLVLPIIFSDFQSKKGKDNVILRWTTQQETNFSHFIVERSTDGKNYGNLAKINGSGISLGSEYRYTDYELDVTTTNYYRLKIVDTDGSFSYSKVIFEHFEASNTVLIVYPSISTDNTIEVNFREVAENAQIKIFNINGQLMRLYPLKAGTSTETIDIAAYTEGVYFLVLQDSRNTQTRKFIKQ